MISSRMRSRGRVTVPKEIREKLGLAPGTTLRFLFQDGQLHLLAAGEKHTPVAKTGAGRQP